MSRGMAGEVWRGASQQGPARRSAREFRDVRHPGQPDLHVEWVRVCPSGIHVVTSLTGDDAPQPASPEALRARAAAEAVASLLPPRYRGRVRAILCRTDGAEVADLVGEVLVTSSVPLEHILRSSPVVLSTSEINEVGMRLGARLEPFPVPQVRERRRRGWWRAVLALGALGAAGAATVAQDLVPLVLPW